MTTHEDLLAAIHAAPDDLAPRLVYADLLLERDDPLGEFVQVDCALAALPLYHADRARLIARRTEIFDEHLRDGWLDWYRWEQMFPRFARGFVEGIHYYYGSQHFERIDEILADMYQHWSERTCRCGRRHDPLMWTTPEHTFPLIRRFGGVNLNGIGPKTVYFSERRAHELRLVANDSAEWFHLTSIDTLRSVLVADSTNARGFEHVLAMPSVVELGFDRSPALIDHLARHGVPKHIRMIGVEPGLAEPLRTALEKRNHPFVENDNPTKRELVLVTDPKRTVDLAFSDRPHVLVDDPVPFELDPQVEGELQSTPNPEVTWPRRGQIDPGEPDARFAVASRSNPSPTRRQVLYGPGHSIEDVGIAIESIGPVYCRLSDLDPDKPVLVIWRIAKVPSLQLQVIAGGELIAAPTPQIMGNWVFVVPAECVRSSSVQLTIAAPPGGAFSLMTLRYYQPRVIGDAVRPVRPPDT